MRIEELLSDGAKRFATRAAIVAEDRRHTYADLARNSDRVSAGLIKRGLKNGERVALFMGSSLEAAVCIFGVLKAGGVVAPIDPASDADEVVAALRETRAVAVITEARLASVAASAMAHAQGIRMVMLCGGDRSTAQGSCLSYEHLVGGIGQTALARSGPAEDPAVFLPSTADGAVVAGTLAHNDLITASLDYSARTVVSLFSLAGLCQLLAAVRAGATLVLESPTVLHSAASAAPLAAAI